ncbi:ABC transporter ATP-binding protein [Dongia sp.]|uniref:ABC transporter ATP-binding protein n=1 Tax=Dongia sp. TaxID=1977262 RepID=UPI003751381E
MNRIEPVATALLTARNLSVMLHTRSTSVSAVQNVSFSCRAGSTLAIVGESGSGKTVLNLAPLDLMPVGVTVDLGGELLLDGQDLLKMSAGELRKVKGSKIGVIFQDPLSALNPARPIGRQIAEVVERHLGVSAAAAEARTVELLRTVGIPDAETRMRQYPHELSGGMRQRVMIAIAIAAEPKILIADEPTTALDVTVQAQIIRLLKDLQQRFGMAIILITHDIGVVSGMADDVAVMYAGRFVETGKAADVLVDPAHPYTKSLLAAIPRESDPVGAPFRGLSGMPPNLSQKIVGCAFAPRCESAIPICGTDRPALGGVPLMTDRFAACHLLDAAVVNKRARAS